MLKKALPLEVDSLEERQFTGYGSIFGNADLGDDIVVKGAFKNTLVEKRRAGKYPPMLWSHDPTRVAGKWLSMEEDSRGLLVKGELADTPLGNEIHTLLKMDAVSGMSIGFVIRDQDYDRQGNRLIKEVDLWELSICAIPMNPLAQVANVKTQTSALGEYVPTPRELERILRDVGFSKSISKRLIHKVYELEDGGTPEASDEDRALKAAQEILDSLMADRLRKLKS